MTVIHVEVNLLVLLEVEQAVVDRALTAEWQSQFYRFDNEAEVLRHLAYNIAVRRVPLSRLDGWADCADTDAQVCGTSLMRDDL